MKRNPILLTVAALLACSALVANAEVKTTVEHNVGDKASAEFKFKDVPSPVKDKAKAAKTTVTIVDGDKDDAGADVDMLSTGGTLPDEEDKPDANFFFNAGTDGGRLLVDLGSATPVAEFNTYSWHKDTRGPQVYKLYAADGTAAGFNAKPKAGTNPTDVGWKLVASVDTRPKDGDQGGQYGVSVKDTAGAALGTYRYFLLDVHKTEDSDDFGNTFFSRIDVIPATAGGATTMPAK